MYHNLRLPHSSIRQALFQPKATNGTGSVKRWRPCPPAMAAGLYPPLPLGGRLVGMLGAIVEAAVLAMFRARQHFPLGRLVAFEPIRDEDPWHTGQALWVG
jgi:hypothetical protein